MMNSSRSLNRPLNPFPLSIAIFMLVVALLGFADATYLTIEHYLGRIPPCSIVAGCDTVLTSQYSSILGIPVSLLGSIFYFLVLIGIFSYIESRKTGLMKWSLILTIPGFLFSLWFVYIQIFTLGSYCLYCLASAATSTLLFVAAMHVFSRYQEND